MPEDLLVVQQNTKRIKLLETSLCSSPRRKNHNSDAFILIVLDTNNLSPTSCQMSDRTRAKLIRNFVLFLKIQGVHCRDLGQEGMYV